MAIERDTACAGAAPSRPAAASVRSRRPRACVRTVGLVSLGCPRTSWTARSCSAACRRAATSSWPTRRHADVIVVNTCAFIDRAKQESVDTILEMAREKETGRARRLVVTGCLAQRYDEELRREIPEIDATLGTGQVDDILRAVEGEATITDAASGRPTWVYDHTAPRVLSTRGATLAYVKISEGCDYTCSFCIIPTLRGRHRSRNVDDIVGRGARAGRPRRAGDRPRRPGLDALRPRPRHPRRPRRTCCARLGRVDGIRWIRVMYAYPATLTDGILDAIADEEKVVKYVDIPLQHASDAVLQAHEAAHRPRQPARAWSSASARACPAWPFRTSFIVGLPGRDRGRVRRAPRLRRGRASSTTSGVFTFSDEEGTTSFDLPGPGARRRVKERRRRRLMAAAEEDLAPGATGARVGERVEVLVEGTHPDTRPAAAGPAGHPGARDRRRGHHQRRRRPPPGTFVTCEITEAHPYDLVARIVADARREPPSSCWVSRTISVSMNVPARGAAPEWVRPTLFFGSSKGRKWRQGSGV